MDLKRALFSSGNILAGISVGAYMIPQAMAYGALAGIDPSTGLAVAAIPLAVYMILGRSVHMSLGPESTVALMAAAAVGPAAAASGMDPMTALAIATLMVGVILFVGWLLRASFLADMLSHPILVGYLTGVAVLMIMSQLPKALGLDLDTSSVLALIQSPWGEPNWQIFGIAAMVVVISLIASRIDNRIPGPLIGLVAAIIVAAPLNVPKVGPVSLSLPVPHLNAIDLSVLSVLFVPALSIAIVSFTDVMATSRAFAGNVPPNPSSEMRALAVAQAATGLTGGYPMSASSSRTALAFAAGATTRFYSVFVLVILLAGPLLIPGVISNVPIAGLAGVVIYAAILLIEPGEWINLARFRKREVSIAAATSISVVLLGILPGVLIAIGLSVLEFMARLARPHEGILGFVEDMAGMHDIDDWDEAQQVPGLVVFRYDAPLFFLNAFDFFEKVTGAVQPDTQVVILNMEANVELDTTALGALNDVHDQLRGQGIELWLARVKNDVRTPMMDHGIGKVIGEQHMYPTLPTAIDEFRRRFEKPSKKKRNAQ